jgi:hypothetical protein
MEMLILRGCRSMRRRRAGREKKMGDGTTETEDLLTTCECKIEMNLKDLNQDLPSTKRI